MVRLLLILTTLLAASPTLAGYNRQIGPYGLPEPAYTAGQLMRATGADDAAFSGGADDRVMVGSGSTWVDVLLPTCNLAANPPTFLTYDPATNLFACTSATVLVQPAMQVVFGTGAGVTSSPHLMFDDATNELKVGTNALPGSIQFTMNASTFGFAQVQGRGGGSYVRFYPNRNVAIASDNLYLGVDSQNDSATDGIYVTTNNNDAGVGQLRYGLREDGKILLYSPDSAGIAITFQVPNLGLFDGQDYRLPTAKTSVDRYCLAASTDTVQQLSWVDCALLGGRSGGQTLRGGTASSQSLTLVSNAASALTGNVNVESTISLFPSGVSTSSALAAIDWASTWSITGSSAFPRPLQMRGTVDYQVMPFLGLPPLLFFFAPRYEFAQTGTLAGAAAFQHQSVFYPETGITTTLDFENVVGSGVVNDTPVFDRAGTGAFNASANYVFMRSTGTVQTGVTIDRGTAILLRDWGGAGTLNKQRGLVVENKAKCTAPNCTGISNASTTDYPGAIQTLTAVGNAINFNSRTTVYINQTSASATLTLTSVPTIADGVDGQQILLQNVDIAGNTAIAIQDNGTLAGSNVELSTQLSCPLMNVGGTVLTLNTGDIAEFVFNGSLSNWYLRGCSDL